MIEMNVRRKIVLTDLLKDVEIPETGTLSEKPLTALREFYSTLQGELKASPTNEEEFRKHVGNLELQELAIRKRLAEAAVDVRQFVSRMHEYRGLKTTAKAINTRIASKMASTLHDKHVTTKYASLVNKELKELRFRRKKPVLLQKTSKAG